MNIEIQKSLEYAIKKLIDINNEYPFDNVEHSIGYYFNLLSGINRYEKYHYFKICCETQLSTFNKMYMIIYDFYNTEEIEYAIELLKKENEVHKHYEFKICEVDIFSEKANYIRDVDIDFRYDISDDNYTLANLYTPLNIYRPFDRTKSPFCKTENGNYRYIAIMLNKK